jgi:formylmethanofuran dehydrogenase subunit E
MVQNHLDPENAARLMQERGVTPLEPYRSSSVPWKCRCNSCGATVFPRYETVVRRNLGGCDVCAKKAAAETRAKEIREVDFPAACSRAGVKPLSDYRGAHEKIALECLTCDFGPFELVWSALRNGKGCPECRRKARQQRERKEREAEAVQLLVAAGITPIGPFEGIAKPFLGRCDTCGELVSPRPSGIKSGQGGCLNCGRIRRGLNRRLSRARALEIMRSRDIEIHPDQPYPGNNKPWPGKCAKCGLPVASTLGNARQGRGGCRVCHSLDSDSAFDFFGPAILYLISSERFRAYKIGIAGKDTTRLSAHKSAGWETVLFTHEALGYEANYVEQFVLSWLREEKGVPEAVSNESFSSGGGTETWPHGSLGPDEVWAEVASQFKKAEWPIPRAILQGSATKKTRKGCAAIVDGMPCQERHSMKGYCSLHYRRWKQYGDPLFEPQKKWINAACEVIDEGVECGKPVDRKGMCKTHYWRDWANGSPTALKRPTPQARKGHCSVSTCGNEDYSLGLCKIHYHQNRRETERERDRKPPPVVYDSDICSVDGCERKRSSLGMCHLHYTRTKKYGSPELAGRGPLMMEKLGRCRADDCPESDDQKGLCRRHYSREYKRKRRGRPSLLD